MKSLLYTLCLGLFAFKTFALETDNYLVWDRELPDLSHELNLLIHDEVQGTLDYYNSFPEPLSCEDITLGIAFQFKTTPARKLFEDWTNENLSEKMFPASPYYLQDSILRFSSRFYLKYSGLSPNMNVNGIYFGVDKLSHFGSTGRRYLKEYLKARKAGTKEDDAVKKAILLGLKNENTVLGIWPSGVFSYGDVEANYQGFKFYRKFCLESEGSYLKFVEGQWKLTRKPDLRDYVNPGWDETFNLSYFSPGTWGRVSEIIKSEYCPLMTTPLLMDRFQRYKESKKESISSRFVSELQSLNDRRAPRPQSIEELCRN